MAPTSDIKVDFTPNFEELPPVRTVYRAASKSRPNVWHLTIVYEDGDIFCTCEGYRHAHKCWHLEEARRLNEGDDTVDFSVSLD